MADLNKSKPVMNNIRIALLAGSKVRELVSISSFIYQIDESISSMRLRFLMEKKSFDQFNWAYDNFSTITKVQIHLQEDETHRSKILDVDVTDKVSHFKTELGRDEKTWEYEISFT